jgi:hypothetical protein
MRASRGAKAEASFCAAEVIQNVDFRIETRLQHH